MWQSVPDTLKKMTARWNNPSFLFIVFASLLFDKTQTLLDTPTEMYDINWHILININKEFAKENSTKCTILRDTLFRVNNWIRWFYLNQIDLLTEKKFLRQKIKRPDWIFYQKKFYSKTKPIYLQKFFVLAK